MEVSGQAAYALCAQHRLAKPCMLQGVVHVRIIGFLPAPPFDCLLTISLTRSSPPLSQLFLG